VSRAVLLEAPGRSRLLDIDPPEPGPGQALVRIAAAGICGSDRELYRGGRPEGYRKYPIVPGHEWSGTIEAVGPGCDTALVGRPTVGESFVNCQVCDRCREGETNLCQAAYDEIGFTRPGAFADHLLIPARLLHPLPPGTDLAQAALLEPAAVAAAAALRAEVLTGERVGVVGGGSIGLLVTRFLAALSPGELIVSDLRAERERAARESGATDFRPPSELAGLELDVVVETAGAGDSAATSIGTLRRGGRLVLAGIPSGTPAGLSPSLIVERQLGITSVFGASSAAWSHAVRAFLTGTVSLSGIVTHSLGLEEYVDALDLLGPGVGKIVLRPDPKEATGDGFQT
jgi:2-desacetyl-2-hydroxyethyl bacteriochlorophyllide A dehydrogenase